MKFRLTELNLDNDLRQKWERWPWNLDILISQFKYSPEKTLSFARASLPESVTITSLRKIPQQFKEPAGFIQLGSVADDSDFYS